MSRTDSRLASVLGGVLIGLALAAAFVAAPASYAAEDDPHLVFRIASPEITESSGLVVGTVDPDLVYTMNDSGGTATIYVLDARTGEVVGRTMLAGVEPVDLEALAVGSDGTLVVADIGDNNQDRASVTVYSIPQPGRGPDEVVADAVSLIYSDGPRDAEGALYDAATGRLFIVSKESVGAHVYGSRASVFSRIHSVLQPVAGAPAVATDSTFLTGEDEVVIRTYFAAVTYRYPEWTRLGSIVLPLQRQGESIAAAADGRELWIGTEGRRSKVLSVPLPPLPPLDAVDASTAPTPSASGPPSVSAEEIQLEQRASVARDVIVAAATALAVVLAVGVVLYRRHHAEHS